MTHSPIQRVPTGITGLDDILHGGLPARRLYLLQGPPGAGKTTLALQFLLTGVAAGERGLYITLSETRDEIGQVAQSHGWTLGDLPLYELSAADHELRMVEENTLYQSADVDLREVVKVLLAEVDRVAPTIVVFDSLSEIRTLAQTGPRYRRQLLALKQYFATRACTVLLLDDQSALEADSHVESIAHGVITLEQDAVQYGTDRRRLRVTKLRGSSFRSGYHDFVIKGGGLHVYPRLIASEHRTDQEAEPVSSGIPGLDRLLGGGLDRATSTLLVGPAGSGKSIVATHFACALAERGERSALFVFEERPGTFRRRAKLLGLPLEKHLESKTIELRQVDPAELAPDEFAHMVRDAVEKHEAKLVVLDSITGYFSAMPEGRFLLLQMHELLSYLAERGVISILTLPQSGMIGTMTSVVDISYLADSVVLFRYYEAQGHVRKAISVMKKRSGMHETSIRDLSFGPGGVRVGEPLEQLRGVLTGAPTFVDEPRA